MKFFFGKGKIVEENIFKYLDLIKKEKDLFTQCLEEYLKTNKLKHSAAKIGSVHSYESKADDMRREIELSMYNKALLPQFRGDIIRLLELIDKLPNKCESILYMISLQNLKIPKMLKEGFRKLIIKNAETFGAVHVLITSLFKNPKEVQAYGDKIDKIESASDAIERELISAMFSSKTIDKCDRILLKELVLEIGSISDYGEHIADMATIIHIKVKV
ncbi:MAG: DUF47 family protein [Spirochaetes bacterium]|nr:DUF47 family protein [Spirochaetota bacterium]